MKFILSCLLLGFASMTLGSESKHKSSNPLSQFIITHTDLLKPWWESDAKKEDRKRIEAEFRKLLGQPNGDGIYGTTKPKKGLFSRAKFVPAPVNTPDEHGLMPLHWAIQTDNTACIDALVAAGAEVNAPDPAGLTPATVARVREQREACEHLLREHKGEVKYVNAEGKPLIRTSKEFWVIIEEYYRCLAFKSLEERADLFHSKEAILTYIHAYCADGCEKTAISPRSEQCERSGLKQKLESIWWILLNYGFKNKGFERDINAFRNSRIFARSFGEEKSLDNDLARIDRINSLIASTSPEDQRAYLMQLGIRIEPQADLRKLFQQVLHVIYAYGATYENGSALFRYLRQDCNGSGSYSGDKQRFGFEFITNQVNPITECLHYGDLPMITKLLAAVDDNLWMTPAIDVSFPQWVTDNIRNRKSKMFSFSSDAYSSDYKPHTNVNLARRLNWPAAITELLRTSRGLERDQHFANLRKEDEEECLQKSVEQNQPECIDAFVEQGVFLNKGQKICTEACASGNTLLVRNFLRARYCPFKGDRIKEHFLNAAVNDHDDIIALLLTQTCPCLQNESKEEHRLSEEHLVEAFICSLQNQNPNHQVLKELMVMGVDPEQPVPESAKYSGTFLNLFAERDDLAPWRLFLHVRETVKAPRENVDRMVNLDPRLLKANASLPVELIEEITDYIGEEKSRRHQVKLLLDHEETANRMLKNLKVTQHEPQHRRGLLQLVFILVGDDLEEAPFAFDVLRMALLDLAPEKHKRFAEFFAETFGAPLEVVAGSGIVIEDELEAKGLN